MFLQKKDSLSWAHPLVRDWFIHKFGLPTEPQEEGWPSILAGKNTLISAPTGSGKTFAAFLTCIDDLVRKAVSGTLHEQTEVVYVSPLKALSNDIHKNLMEPLNEILQLAKERGLKTSEIRVALRTGDTLMRERQAMLRKPPHILVTTPESLYILLTAEKSRALLQTVKTVIVDEIHALLNDKRGTHLALSLERLEALLAFPLVRIGLSATQKPITLVADFLTGNDRPKANIIHIGHVRQLELKIEVPPSELSAVAANEQWDETYDKIAHLSKENRSTLVFVNTRRLAERVAHHLAERIGEEKVLAHHGSLSRKLRLVAETKLKNGELKILVATASLELGIDIGSVDLVCQIGSPRSIAVMLQRVGRAGHWHGAVSKGRIFVTTRDELLESAALVYAIYQGDLDQLIMPREPLDILAQQIIATCATGEWREDDLFALVKRAYPYKNLKRATFDTILSMLSEGIAGVRGRYGTYLFRDGVNLRVKGRRGSRLTAITSGGAIPENGLFTVIAQPHNTMVGTLDEDFAVESNRGDIILLGTTSWQIKRVESALGRVLVEDAHGAPPSVPFWRGEAPARTIELSEHVSSLRQKINDMLPKSSSPKEVGTQAETQNALTWLQKECSLNQAGAEQLVEYILQGRSILGAVPTQQTIIAERFFDEAGGMQLVIHAPFGARINKAWGLALRKRFCRSFNFELQAAATDDGLNIALAEQHSFPLSDVFHFLHPNTLKDVLTQAVLQSPLFATRWRWTATRSLALVRFRYGRKVPPNILRMLSDDLLAAVFPDAAACQDNLGGRDIELPDHPLTNEAMKNVLTEALDIAGLSAVLRDILDGKIQCIAVDTPVPSVFSHEILNANPYAYLDDAPLEERRARAVEMRRMLPESVLDEVGKLDKAAIDEVQAQCWPDIREADELHEFLQEVIALPEKVCEQNWHDFFAELVSSGCASVALINNKRFYLCAEKMKSFLMLYPDAKIVHALADIEIKLSTREECILTMLRGWLLHMGPMKASELKNLLEFDLQDLEQALLKLEASGFILRGHFRNHTEEIEWCERRLLARIHRLTIGRLRKEIEPVSAFEFVSWLRDWQHVSPGTQLRGEHGLLEIIKKLQGFELPANAWEHHIFAKRMVGYDKTLLEHLCLSGVIGWGRLSSHPVINEENGARKKRIMPTRITPITFFVREEAEWLLGHKQEINLANLSHAAQCIYLHLQKRGASFFADIVRGVDKLKSEVEMGLWELVAAGLITADSFDNLRALIDPRRRLDRKKRRIKPRDCTGRWSLLHGEESKDKAKETEALCWLLLKRYGVVFRDLLQREKIVSTWRELLIAFRRLEARGEIRGGRFVSGFLGEQFALPYAVDSLRAKKKKNEVYEEIQIAAADPLNLHGIILPGSRIPGNMTGKSVSV